VGFAVMLGVAYALRSEIATDVAAFMLDRSDSTRCSHPEIVVDSSLEEAEVGPIECRVYRGPMRRGETFGRTRILLDGFQVKHMYVPRATFDFRERDISHVETNTLGDLADFVGMSESLIKGALDARDQYDPDAKPMTIGQVTMLRAGKKESQMFEQRQQMDGVWLRTYAARVATGIEGLAEVRNFDMRVTPKRARLTMGIYLGEAERGEKPDGELRLEGRDLDSPHPKFDLSLATDESRESRRTREGQEQRAARSTKAATRD
jgi:hypothetical protein